METDQSEIKNLGQIKTSDGTFSKALKAKFETVTTFKPSVIFITAEDDANITDPSYERILTTSKIYN
jgi:acetoin utilization deacetylase AcuC-like enzyme